jgi:hypothetical protein
MVAKDVEAMQALLEFLAANDGQSREKHAQREAMENDGLLFAVPNGTRGDVLREAKLDLGPNVNLKALRVRLTSGTHAGEEVIYFNVVTQPDRSAPAR